MSNAQEKSNPYYIRINADYNVMDFSIISKTEM